MGPAGTETLPHPAQAESSDEKQRNRSRQEEEAQQAMPAPRSRTLKTPAVNSEKRFTQTDWVRGQPPTGPHRSDRSRQNPARQPGFRTISENRVQLRPGCVCRCLLRGYSSAGQSRVSALQSPSSEPEPARASGSACVHGEPSRPSVLSVRPLAVSSTICD